MRASPGFLHRIPLYPLLVGLYPVLFLWMANFDQIKAYAIAGPLVYAIGIAVGVCLVSLLAFRNLRKAGAAAGLFLVLFFFYGHVLDLVSGWSIFGIKIDTNGTLLVVWAILFIAGLIDIIRVRTNLANLTWIFNLVLSFLVFMTLVQIGYAVINKLVLDAKQADVLKASSMTVSSNANTPDVYYIVADSFNRQDLLKKDEALDDQAFIAQLESLGFVVPNCTQSNYYHTIISMAATLNMDYLDRLGYASEDIAQGDLEYVPLLSPALLNNKVMQKFRSAGYKIITLKSIWPFIDFKSSDQIIDVFNQDNSLQNLESNNFLSLFWKTTLLRLETDFPLPLTFNLLNGTITGPNANTSEQYQQNIYQLNSLSQVPQIAGPKFVYAHLMATHFPFTFTPGGEYSGDEPQNQQGYADAVTFTSQELLSIVKTLISEAKTPPIIVLQADHAFSQSNDGDSFKILNAYYLPGGGSSRLYPTITPVNTFRLIFSEYFGQDYFLLPDQSMLFDSKYPGGYQVFPSSCVR